MGRHLRLGRACQPAGIKKPARRAPAKRGLRPLREEHLQLDQRIARGFNGAGIAEEHMLFIDFPLLEPSTTIVRIYLPLVQLEALIDTLTQLRSMQAAAPGSCAAH